MKGDFNAQDAFAQLVEDVRIGQVRRPISREKPARTDFVPHRIDLDLNLPVFHVVGDHHHIPVQEALAAWEAIGDRTFHLPYPRCAFMMSLPGTHPGLKHLLPRFHVRHSYIIVCEEDDERLHLIPFMKAAFLDHWVRQLFDIYIPLGSEDVITMYDPAWGDFPANFIASVEASLWDRLSAILGFAHQMMTRKGAASPATGTSVTEKINARRSKMSFPPVPGVITIDLDKPPVISEAKSGPGTPKKPHFRRGSWHTRKATGKRSWHPPVAVHGGSEIVPPWYEVKTSV